MGASRGSRALERSRVNDGYGAPNSTRAQSSTQQRSVVAARFSFSGPLPPASELEKYKAIVPDMPERLLANFEKQTDHRQALERRVIEGDVQRAHWGLVAGWTFAMSLLVASVYLIATGHESVGVMALLGELAALGGSFVYSDYRRRQERNRKAGS